MPQSVIEAAKKAYEVHRQHMNKKRDGWKFQWERISTHERTAWIMAAESIINHQEEDEDED